MPARVTKGKSDRWVKEVKAVLDGYVKDYPGSVAELFRAGPGSIRVRITDERFDGQPIFDRHDFLWEYLEPRLSWDAMSQITFLLGVGPTEKERFANSVAFDQTVPVGG